MTIRAGRLAALLLVVPLGCGGGSSGQQSTDLLPPGDLGRRPGRLLRPARALLDRAHQPGRRLRARRPGERRRLGLAPCRPRPLGQHRRLPGPRRHPPGADHPRVPHPLGEGGGSLGLVAGGHLPARHPPAPRPHRHAHRRPQHPAGLVERLRRGRRHGGGAGRRRCLRPGHRRLVPAAHRLRRHLLGGPRAARARPPRLPGPLREGRHLERRRHRLRRSGAAARAGGADRDPGGRRGPARLDQPQPGRHPPHVDPLAIRHPGGAPRHGHQRPRPGDPPVALDPLPARRGRPGRRGRADRQRLVRAASLRGRGAVRPAPGGQPGHPLRARHPPGR